MTALKKISQQCESGEQCQQVRQDHPLVGEGRSQAGQAWTEPESSEEKFIENERGEADERYAKRVTMKNRDPGQHQSEEDEVERDVKNRHRFRH